MQSDKTPPEDPLSPEKKKKEVISVYVAILCVLLIGISFVWHLVSALIANP